MLVTLTTGAVAATVYDADNDASTPSGPAVFDAPVICPGDSCPNTGAPFDCDALRADPAGGLRGGALAFAHPLLDSAAVGDAIVAGVLSFE